tara:strand:- start:762 stop:2486 length:1725 start_codon:yes stop_codon:yes gene_type:complete
MTNFQKLFFILDKKQKKSLFFLSILLLFVSILEITFLHSVFILINSITSNDYSFIDLFSNLFFLDNLSPEIALLAIFVIFFLFKSTVSILAIKYEAKFIYNTREDLTKSFFNKYVNLPKLFQIKLSVANLVKKIVVQVESLMSAMKAVSTLFLEISVLVLITIYLLNINFYATLYIFIIFLIFSIIIIKINKKKVVDVGKEQVEHYDKIIQTVNEIFSGLKFFKNEKFNNNYKKKFLFHNKRLSEIGITIFFRNGTVRPIFELVILLILVSTLVYILLYKLTLNNFIPQIAVFVVASYRIMPSYVRIITAIQIYKYNIQPVNEYYSDIKTIFEKNTPRDFNQNIEFKNNIELKNISFNYNFEKPNKVNPVLDKINLTIIKNSKNCIIGESGSGKSTLLDIVMGLLEPGEGKILVDGKQCKLGNSNWQNKIGFVSQNIYITNNSLKENIAFGYDEHEIDDEKIKKCLDICNLSNFVNNLSLGLDTKLSDLGTNISGGQKQRIGIARALYNSPEILILDEPTNNLDEKNELIIINNLLNLEKITLIVTTHKNELKNKFNKVFEVNNNTVLELKQEN